ncbi:MAG: porin [Psychrobacter celer]
MKKLLLATAVAALSVSAANAAPTVYGKAFVTMDYVNTDDGNEDSDSVQINSNSSRIGFKGSEAMTANTDIIYQLEYGIDIDADDSKTFASRDTYLGFANKDFGQFRFGRNQSTTDYVNNVLVSDAYFDNLGNFMADSGRVDNSVIWLAPKYQGLPLQIAAMYAADETSVEDSSDRNSGFGVSAMFDQGTGFTAGLAYDKDVNIEDGGDIIRGSATVDLGKYMAAPVTLGALYQVADYDATPEDEKGLLVSAALGLSNFAKPASIYAQYNNTSDKGGVKDVDADQIVVGGKYFYQPNMIAHAYAGANTIEEPGSDDRDEFAIGGGLEYKF